MKKLLVLSVVLASLNGCATVDKFSSYQDTLETDSSTVAADLSSVQYLQSLPSDNSASAYTAVTPSTYYTAMHNTAQSNAPADNSDADDSSADDDTQYN